jgi:hypothetical protein
MTAPDPTAGEGCGRRGYPHCDGKRPCACPCHDASPPAVAASTGTSEDVEALWSAIVAWTDDPTDEATEAVERIVAAREAAARAEERERITQAIEATQPQDWAWPADREYAARIAREGR